MSEAQVPTASSASSQLGEESPDDESSGSESSVFHFAEGNTTPTNSWTTLEAILDRKLDALRSDVFARSTPLPPPPISAEVQEALVKAILSGIHNQREFGQIASHGASRSINGDISTSLLVAIHETQEMLHNIQAQGSLRPSVIADTPQDIVLGKLRHIDESIEAITIPRIQEQFAAALDAQLQTGIERLR